MFLLRWRLVFWYRVKNIILNDVQYVQMLLGTRLAFGFAFRKPNKELFWIIKKMKLIY